MKTLSKKEMRVLINQAKKAQPVVISRSSVAKSSLEDKLANLLIVGRARKIENKCHLWCGSVDPRSKRCLFQKQTKVDGKVKTKIINVSNLVWENAGGRKPEDCEMLHRTCGNPHCLNVRHMRLEYRYAVKGYRRNVVLTEAQKVKALKLRVKGMMTAYIAAKLGVATRVVMRYFDSVGIKRFGNVLQEAERIVKPR